MESKLFDACRYIGAWVRRMRFRLIVWSIRKYHPEGVSYDPDYRMYIFRWTKELDEQLCSRHKPDGVKTP